MNRTQHRAALGLAVSLVLVLAGCSTKAGEAKDTSGSDGVKTGPGVTADAISLGILTDITGPAASLGKPALQAEQIYVDQVNAAGGVCGRKLKLVVRDHGYDVQKAVAAYAEIQPEIAALTQMVGSSQTAALLDSFEKDKVLTIPLGSSAALLGRPHVRLIGSTYAIDAVNGMSFIVGKAKLKKGDKVGAVHLEGEAGNAFEGYRFAAEKSGLKVVEQVIKPTDTDLTAQVTALKAAGVKAVVLAGLPAQTASLVGVAAASGLKVPVLSTGIGYVPQLLDSPAKPALEKMLWVVSAYPAMSSENPAVVKAVKDYKAAYPNDKVNQGVQVGTANGAVTVGALKEACKAKDLSRDGITAAMARLTNFTTDVAEPQNLSDNAEASSRNSFVLQPDAGVPGGLKSVKEAVESPLVAEFLASSGN
ncbi:ABC transporter substrate-binding protein [Streptomyces sp. NBC_00656]|uniref:ABC transporter substrate-binding protein n=1 Tax=Streptomyces sp. NBC_00656 TaxID=2903668 RepID=UPI00324D59B7